MADSTGAIRHTPRIIPCEEPTARRRRILIVEDNRGVAQAMQFLLKREGFDTAWCDDERVYELVREWQPDLILMDLMMPRLDGLHVTRQLKLDPASSEIPVIIVTANPVAPQRIVEVHANDMVPKPFHVRRLLERIRFWLNRSGARGAGRPWESQASGERLTS